MIRAKQREGGGTVEPVKPVEPMQLVQYYVVDIFSLYLDMVSFLLNTYLLISNLRI